MSLKIKEYLDYKSEKYNNPSFIQEDPIQIPHLFQKKEDIEISGFLTATIAWGNRKSIIKSSKKIVEFFGNKPYDFIMNHNDSDLKKLESFKHRTFNGYDLIHGGMLTNFVTIRRAMVSLLSFPMAHKELY